MKPVKEEKTDSKTGVSKILFILLLYSINIFPQNSLNNFFLTNKIPINQGYTTLHSSKNNLILKHKSYLTIVSNDFKSKQNIYFGYNILHVAPLDSEKISIISEKPAKILFYKKYLKKKILEKEYILNYQPDGLVHANLDNKGSDEVILYGVNYPGLSFYFNKKHLDIATNINYNKVAVVDFNNDGFKDIAAFNFIERKIECYYNNQNESFYFARGFEIKDHVENLIAGFFNNDKYEDLFIISSNYIDVLINDQVSSFSVRYTTPAKSRIYKALFEDVDKNDSKELIYLDKQGLSYFLSVDSDYKITLPFIDDISITDWIVSDKAFYVLTNNALLMLSDTLSFNTIVASANSYKTFNSSGKNYQVLVRGNNLFVIDKESNQIFYSIILRNEYKNLQVFEQNEFRKYFVCYSSKTNFFEVVKLDFQKGSLSTVEYYLKGDILDISMNTTYFTAKTVYKNKINHKNYYYK